MQEGNSIRVKKGKFFRGHKSGIYLRAACARRNGNDGNYKTEFLYRVFGFYDR